MISENGNPIYKRVMIIDDTYVDRYVAERNIIKYGIPKIANSSIFLLNCIIKIIIYIEHIKIPDIAPTITNGGSFNFFILIKP